LPDLIETEAPILAIRMIGLDDLEGVLLSKFSQFILREVVDVAKPAPTAPPIEQVIASVDLTCGQFEFFPGHDPVPQPLAGKEIPYRKVNFPLRCQQTMDGVQQPNTGILARYVVQYSETQDPIKPGLPGEFTSHMRGPIGLVQIEMEEARPIVADCSGCAGKQDRAAVDAEIAPCVTLLKQIPGQLGVAAAQVEHVRLGWNRSERSHDPRLQALACVGELLAKRLVE